MKKSVLFVIAICIIIVSVIVYKYEKQREEQTTEEIKIEYESLKSEELETETEIATIQKNSVDMVTEENNEEYENISKIEHIKYNDRQNIKDGTLIGSLEFGSKDALILHKISVAEAGTESVESMALIMLVVLNRTYSDEFPDTIYDVVHQKKQFTPISDGNYDEAEPNEKSQEAMELVLSGWDGSQGALYFEACKGESWHSKNLKLLFEKDGIRFYKERK